MYSKFRHNSAASPPRCPTFSKNDGNPHFRGIFHLFYIMGKLLPRKAKRVKNKKVIEVKPSPIPDTFCSPERKPKSVRDKRDEGRLRDAARRERHLAFREFLPKM